MCHQMRYLIQNLSLTAGYEISKQVLVWQNKSETDRTGILGIDINF